MNTAKVTINKRSLTVTTGSGNKVYDGTPLTNSTATAAVAGGNVDGEIITATVIVSKTEVGSSTNGYTMNWGSADANNYEVTDEVLGTLTVSAATPTPVATPEAEPVEDIMDAETPLAAEPDAPAEDIELEDEAVPLASGKGGSWALINFALMNLAIFESIMLLIGYFVKTKNDKDEEEEEKRKLKKKGIIRILSTPVAVISLIAFILTEDITLPTGFVDKYTIWMAVIAIVQTVVVALSNKKYQDEEEEA